LQSLDGGLVLRRPGPEEGQALHDLIRRSPPLDVNSIYCYHLLARHFRETCVMAEIGGSAAGCITAYLRPDEPATLFVWQVAVLEDFRGHGVAGRMLDMLLERPVCRNVRYLETTVGPSNHASRRCFERLAGKRDGALCTLPFLDEDHFGPAARHEAEVLLRIGPFRP
jgi:L-2,4-diaminobutyric acid acetyltransferase